ncbi:hypothetical protein [Salinibacterium sp. ZJ450]|uniref:hypothetical protein n=1 Tax=Salinibacterium sp. ZJ450 TaxID=2708338 RepID=UPI00141ED602|nr:hypothetical protein [Salinibacterium sp. ZJ450]
MAIFAEVAPIVVVVFASIVVLNRFVSTTWHALVFYNADSLVLPLVEESLQRGEPQDWVFSSQNFLFPESLFYFVSTLFTDSVELALAINVTLNLVVLYVLLRINARLLAHRSRHRFVEVSVAMLSTLLFVTFVLLEPQPTINRGAIATLYLMSTYYYGVIVVGLAMVALTLWATKTFSLTQTERKRAAVYGVAVFVLGGLTTFSNPLYILQVVAPLLMAITLLVLWNRLSWRGFWLIAAIHVASVGAGLAGRTAFPQLFASDVSSYLALNNIPLSLASLRDTVVELLGSAAGAFKFVLIVGLLVVVFAVFVFAAYAQSRPRLAKRITTAEVFVVAFVAASVVSLFAGYVATGSTTTRYLEPVFIFPLLLCVLIGVYVLRRMIGSVWDASLRRGLNRLGLALGGVCAAGIVVLGALSLPPVASFVRGDSYVYPDCLDVFLDGSNANGVASFWAARPLEVYGDHEGTILQVNDDLTAFEWMINRASYDKSFSYVLIDGSPFVPVQALDRLGEPAEVVDCGAYQIYDFEQTPGEQILTDIVRGSIDAGERG